ncbi:heparan-alpha-glucosaminide N-acetyltransferase [Prunus yedoensis var. nudiflora]|uniref:Heparan-alpha-glucosaminide N-acetyltransferase n=1 Tax=Prunus yedoensis var. nudiflora TaxID=2094558 RepID=A0A314XPN1_PRUYE|nr:heparan-alpha-glucosaminide N-acetyltransferase [Prunus yedoensis var. nudiflora]
MEDDARKLEEGRLYNKDHFISEKVNKTSDHNGGGNAIDHDHEEKNKVAVVATPLEEEQIKGNDAGGSYARIDHSPWNGCTLADFVMPFFLFIVGVAIALALKKIPKINDAIKKIILRTLKLMFWGIILQGGYSHAPDDLSYGVDMKKIRWFGILQRIALVYFVVALIETFTTKLRPTVLEPGHLSIFTAYKWQWIGGFVAFLVYMITTFSLYVPDWSFVVHNKDHGSKEYLVKCGMRGHLGPACNAVGYVDRQVWGINHIYTQPVWRRLKACTLSSPSDGPLREGAPSWCTGPFEPEGLLRMVKLDSHACRVTLRLKQWVSMGFVLIVIAIILHFTDAIPINKQLYSFSYVCFTAGAAGLVFSGFYLLIDVWGYRTPFLFLEWIGMNAMLVFVMAAQGIFAAFVNGWYYKSPDNSLVHWIQKHVFINVWHSKRLGTLLYVIFGEILFWVVVAGILHKFRIYWKL